MPAPSGIVEEDEGSQSSDAGAIRFEAPVVEITSSESEKDIAPRPSNTQKGKKRVRRAHSDESASPVVSDAEGDGKGVCVRKGKRSARKKAVAVLDSDEEDVQPRRRKLIKGERPSSPVVEVVDLLDEVEEESTSTWFASLTFL